MAQRKTGLLGLFFNSRSASLSLPLLAATVFSFGYVLIHQPKAAAPVTSTSQNQSGKTSGSLPDIPLAEQEHLPLVETGTSNPDAGSTKTASPQNGAVPNNGSSQASANSNSSAIKTTQKNTSNPVTKVIVPLLP